MAAKITHATLLEVLEFWADYLKQLTALSTGAVVLATTFFEKLFAHPQWKLAAVISIASFVICVLSSVGSFLIAAGMIDAMDETVIDEELPSYVLAPWGKRLILSATISFCLGVVFLAAFAIRNIM